MFLLLRVKTSFCARRYFWLVLEIAMARNSHFFSLWSAHAIALIGTNTGFVILPLIALNITGASVLEMGILEAAESLAVMLFGIWMGRIPDSIGGEPLWCLLIS